MKFVCKNCNYRFESDYEQTGKPCSYCGEPEVAKEKSADEIVEDAE